MSVVNAYIAGMNADGRKRHVLRKAAEQQVSVHHGECYGEKVVIEGRLSESFCAYFTLHKRAQEELARLKCEGLNFDLTFKPYQYTAGDFFCEAIDNLFFGGCPGECMDFLVKNILHARKEDFGPTKAFSHDTMSTIEAKEGIFKHISRDSYGNPLEELTVNTTNRAYRIEFRSPPTEPQKMNKKSQPQQSCGV